MSAVCKIVETCRIVSLCARRPLYIFNTKFILNVPAPKVFTNKSYFSNSSVWKMAQKSITSFFKITPKKLAETPVEEEKLASSHDEDSPIKKNNEKRTSKRQRLDSSDGETADAATVTNGNNSEKKKLKRQRIESSGSESETKPNNPKPVTRKINGPIKTYSSPKSTKNKVKKESPVAKEHKSPKIKEEKKSPEKTANGERKSVSPVQNGNVSRDKKESLSPKSDEEVSSKETSSPKDVKVKEEKKTPKSKKDSKKDASKQKETGAKDDTVVKGDGGIVAEVDYNPAKSKYHPVADACWTKGQAVPYLALARTLEAIEATSARLKMIDILANYFRSVIALTPEDLLPSVYMCLNQLAPAYLSLELGIAETYLMKAIGQCTGRTVSQVRSAAQRTGDLGSVAESARATQRTMFTPASLTARGVFAALRDIARMTGQASVNKKISKIQTLYVACRHSEAKFLIRSLEGKLRIGLAEQSVLQALAVAVTGTPPAAGQDLVLDASHGVPPDEYKKRIEENALIIKTTYCECPDYDRVIPVLLQHGVCGLPQHCRLSPGTPLKPMLAHPTKGVHEVFNRFEGCQFTCEWKYDGERAQIHVPGEDQADLTKAAIFSRNQENNTSKYPDILRRLPSLLKDSVKSCVLDCEAVAYDVANKQILPFQILSTRKRKDAAEAEIKVQVCVFVFDLLYLNGRPLVRDPLAVRRRLLREHFHEVEGEWQFARSQDCSSMEEVQAFLEEAVKGSCEGLMVKTLEGDAARYDIARRSRNWLKLKKDYLEGVGDTIDVVVIGAYRGRGKRAGVYGGFLLACHDRDSDEYQSLCKIGTGFSDDDLTSLSEKLAQHVIPAPRSYYRFESSHAADVWVSPACVWEIRCADLSLSPAHRAAIGLVDPDKGISLRFPRFIREREDKTPEQATSAQQIAEMYLAQDQVKNQAAGKQVSHDDFY